MGDLITGVCAVAVALSLPFDPPIARQDQRAPGDPLSPQTPTSVEPGEDTRGRPTAEDILKALQRQRPINEVIPPAGTGEGEPGPQRRDLLPEGSAIVSRSGGLGRDGPWWTFVSDPAEGEPSAKLLPNASLEVMVRTAGGVASPIRFVVSGEVSVFEGENYLLLRVVRRAIGAVERAAPQEPPGVGEGSLSARETPDHKPTGQEETMGEGSAADAPVEDVVALLKRQQPKEGVMPVVSPLSDDRSAEDATIARTLIPEGAPLVSRPGRLLRQGDWWTLVFESDHPDHPESPMKLLPNKSVELMLRASQHGSSGLVFLVSGEATVFQGENYLLSRVAMQRVDTGNLRR